MPTSRVPVRAFRTASSITVVLEPIEVEGRDGTAVTGGAVRLSAPVKSPVTERRQAVRFGTLTPNLVSIRRSVDVWSRVPESCDPPALNGGRPSAGVRKRRPIGPAMPAALDGRGEAVRYSPAVPAG